MHCGLLGEKLTHSYSPQIHSYMGNYSYTLFEKTSDELKHFLNSADFQGINVTIPYKKAVVKYCDELSSLACTLGSVNTIVKKADGKLIGHNTDYYGFSYLLRYSGLSVSGKKVLVLGSGGSSVTVVAVLKNAGADVVVISRSGENNYNNLHLHKDAAVIVNTTPVGMYPNNGKAVLDIKQFPALEGVLDIIYNPARTKLLLDAQSRGLIAENGLRMLIAQAKESAEWFTGNTIPEERIEYIYRILQQQMENIILIGMPGCGKSTIGQLLSESLGREFIDSDKYIEDTANKSIPRIFSEDGEDTFRRLESDILAQLGKRSSTVIATGGGCVTQERNYNLLHQNGKIIWLERDISLLPKEGRPLSLQNSLSQMYEIRKPMYEAFADYTVQNDTSAEVVVKRIIKILRKETCK